jgi:hypothetical protein
MKVPHHKNIRTLDVYLTGNRYYVVVHRTFNPWKTYKEPQGLLTEIVDEGFYDSRKTGYITVSDPDEIKRFLKLATEGKLIILDDQVICSMELGKDGSLKVETTGDFYEKDGSMCEEKMRKISGYTEPGIISTRKFIAQKLIDPSEITTYKDQGFDVAIQ